MAQAGLGKLSSPIPDLTENPLSQRFLGRQPDQRLDELLLVLEDADAVLLFGRREFLAHQAAVIHAGLQLVEQLDGLLFGHIEGDAVLLRHLLELLGGHAFQPLGGRDLRHLGGEQLGLFEFRLLQSQQLDQFFLGPQQTDLVFLELGAERRDRSPVRPDRAV